MLQEVDGEDLRCNECKIRDAVGPCAACESMICGDCGVLQADPVGKKVVCLSCARLVAAVAPRPVARRPSSIKVIAVGILVIGGISLLSILLN